MFAGSNQPAVVLFPGALGDLCLALPTLRHLCARHDGAPRVIAVARWLVPLASAAVPAARVEAVDDVALARTLGGGPAPEWWVRGARLYAWIGTEDPEVRARLAGHAEGASFARVVRGSGARHAARDYARAVGWEATWEELVRGAALSLRPASLVASTLAVHRGAGAPAKRWTREGFVAVASWWRGPVVDLRGPADDDLPPLGALATEVRPPIAELAPLLAGAAAFVGGDSGPAHVAAAAGVPSVVVYVATDPTRWRPLGTRVACHATANGAQVIESLRALMAHP